MTDAPSASKVTRMTSVVTVTSCLDEAGAPAMGSGTPAVAAFAATVALSPGTSDGGSPECGGKVAAGAVAVALVGHGNTVACWPSWTCHRSHSITSEKPRIAHRIGRRKSVIGAEETDLLQSRPQQLAEQGRTLPASDGTRA